MSSVTLKNLVPDPFMSANGWSGAVYDTGKAYVGGRSLKLTGTTATPEVVIATSGTIPLVPSHVYYSRMYGWQDGRTNASVGFYWPIAEPSFQEGIPIGAAGRWNLYSGRTGRGSFTSGNYQLRLDFNNSNIAGVMWLDGVMLVDLTAAFGAGKEPSKEWCDAYLPFFESTLEVQTVEVEGVTAVVLTPNPVSQSAALQVSVTIESGVNIAVPYWYLSGDVFAGEV